ncbi:MAG: 30S ribosomal protein S20 [Pseudanabaenaceae cyanobacterium bins.68]|nr:30S ribosomal protein S20 [Pseudanabaenaceae cyanobacterium bins.68]
MANIKSAIKRAKIAERNRLRNKSYKSAVKTLIKRYCEAVDIYKASPSDEALNAINQKMSLAYSKIDKAVKCGIIHPNTGARRKSNLAKLFKTAVPQA